MSDNTQSRTEPNRTGSSRVPTGQTRRRFLRAMLASGVLGLAGCQGDTGTSEPNSPIEERSFDGEHLVVTVDDSAAGSDIHLVDSENTVQARAAAAKSTGKARLRLIDITNPDESENHYLPGKYDIVVAPGTDNEFAKTIDLNPDLTVADVRQYNGNKATDAGRLAIDVKNRGSGPTWASTITYRDAPNETANHDLPSSDYPYFRRPQDVLDSIIPPGGKTTYVSKSIPFIFPADSLACESEPYSLTVLVTNPSSSPVEQSVLVQPSGETRDGRNFGRIVCSDLEVTMSSEDEQ